MMWHPRSRALLCVCGGLVLGLASPAFAQKDAAPPASQTKTSPAPSPDQAIVQALGANPVTAPFRFSASKRDGKYVLKGRVSSTQVHDAAVQTAIALGYPMTDEIVIDTAEANRAVGLAAGALGPLAGAVGPIVAAPFGLNAYIYPPPLFGRYEDPFFGLEPPAISYPPWWRSIVNRQPLEPNLDYPVPALGSVPKPAASKPSPAPALPVPSHSEGPTPPDGTIEMTIDPRGVAVLRGTVPTLAERITLGQHIAQTPGIVEVQNLLNVRERKSSTVPPPPPEPAPPAAQVTPRDPAQNAQPLPVQPDSKTKKARTAIPVDENALDPRMEKAFARRPALSGLPIRATVREGVVSLSGRVPSVYEAMLAYRAAQQTPGVRDVVDRLEFVVPDMESKNPLIQKGRPEDVEPYLEAQVRRQVGDLAHIDRIHQLGDRLELHGSLAREEDRSRVEAILRSMAVLRGFRLEPEFQPE